MEESKNQEIFVQNFASQTEKLDYKDRGVQLKKKLDFQMQTEEEIEEDIKLYEDDSQELLAFIKRIVPLAELELIKNQKSKAFLDYDVNWSTNENETACINTLHHHTSPAQLLVTSCSWNCTGSVIAVAYGSFDHENWCCHNSMLCAWNIDRATVDPKKADLCLDMPACVTYVAYHPTQPSILAAACFNGELTVWDTARTEDMQVGSSGQDNATHREAVTQLVWIREEANRYQLVSTGSDGRILFWSNDVYKKTLKLTKGYVILNESLPRNLQSRSGAGKSVGVTCVSFCPTDDQQSFVVGSDCGAIFKCDVNTRGPPAPAEIGCSVELRSPVNFAFVSHNGPVNAVQYSPHLRNIFMSCSTDSTFRIYSTLQMEALLVVDPGCGYLHSGCWSPTRPSLLCLGSASGQVLFFDLVQSKSVASKQLDANSSVYIIALSSNRPDVVAVGTEDGDTQLWRLDAQLTQSTTNELQVARDIFRIGDN